MNSFAFCFLDFGVQCLFSFLEGFELLFFIYFYFYDKLDLLYMLDMVLLHMPISY